MLTCPTCGEATKQHRAGKNPSGTARRECRHCGRTYTPAPRPPGYGVALRRRALQMYVDGANFRRIARLLSVHHQSVINWVNRAAANLPAPRAGGGPGDPGAGRAVHVPRPKKGRAYVVTCVDRATRRFTGWAVAHESDPQTMQGVVDQAPPAARYFSDGFSVYPTLMYAPGTHEVAPGKSQTYGVEAGNAELRHSLARLARRGRCFSRCLWARAVSLFVYAWDRRRVFKRKHPNLPAHVRDFVADLL